jgi:hypothetical protein
VQRRVLVARDRPVIIVHAGQGRPCQDRERRELSRT